MTTYNLTPGQDIITGSPNTNNTFNGTLSPAFINQTGPTLNSSDNLTGGANSNNLLEITDDYGSGQDVLPAGVQLSNIQVVELLTAGNAGGSNGGSTFNTTSVSGDLVDLIESSGSFTDNVTAASATTIEISHGSTGGAVITSGGLDVGIITYGGNGTEVIGPSRSVVVQDNGGGEDDVSGGVNVTVYATKAGGSVFIGSQGGQFFTSEDSSVTSPVLAAPTGTINVAAALNDFVDINGGTSVGVAAQGATVLVGEDGPTPSGDVVVDNFTSSTTSNSFVGINGGVNVTVSTSTGDVDVANSLGNVAVSDGSPQSEVLIGTPDSLAPGIALTSAGVNVSVVSLGGIVEVGSDNVSNGGTVVGPSGAVTVLDQGSVSFDGIANTANNTVSVIGGTSVSVATNAGNVTVGNDSGDAGANPTGDVAVSDVATGLAAVSYLSPTDAVDVFGGANVTVIAAGGNIQVGGGTAAPGGATATDPTGTVTVFNTAVETGGSYGNHVDVFGGDGVTVGVSGGDITVGQDGAEAAGPISIVDTFSGPNTDGFTVIGGDTVSIITTPLTGLSEVGGGDGFNEDLSLPAVGGNITVGEAPVLTGNTLTNAAAYATGNVTVVNAETFGASTYLGDGTTTIYTDGATAVSVTGGDGATITDVQTTQGTISAIGSSTLSSVTLNGVEDKVSITSDALTSLSVSNTGSVDGSHNVTSDGGTDARDSTAVFINETPAHALALTLSNDLGLSVEDGTATAINITTTGVNPVVGGASVANDVSLTADNATSLSFAGSGNVTLDVTGSSLSSLTTITASGSGAVNLGDLAGSNTLTSINAGASSGPVSVEILPSQTSFVGGSGNDVVTIDSNNFLNSNNNFNTVDGGAGNNTLVVNYAAGTTDVALAAFAHNFQVLEFGPGADSVSAANTYDATGFSQLVNDTSLLTGQIIAVSNVNPNTTLTLDTTFSATILNLVAASLPTTLGAGSNSLTIDEVAGNGGVIEIDGGDNSPSLPNGSGITSVTINTTANPGSTTSTSDVEFIDAVAPGAAGISTLTLEGAGAVDVSAFFGSGSISPTITTINASASSGAVDVSALAQEDALSHSGVAITGGSGLLTADGVSDAFNGDASGSVSSANDVLTTGSGGGDLTLGFGGEWNGAGSYGTGSETVNLSASAAVVDTINIVEGTQGAISALNSNGSGGSGGVTGFKVASNNTTSDRLDYSTPKAVITNLSTKTSVSVPAMASGTFLAAPSGLTYTSANGVITFSSTAGGNVDATYTQAQLVAAAEIIVDSQGADHIATFQSAGNTYVVASGDATPVVTMATNTNSVVELLGVTGVQGFGATETTGTAIAGTAAANAILANVIQVQDTALLAPGPLNAAGFSDVLLPGTTTGNTTITNLGAAGQLDITNAAPGNITVTQVGTAGADSLVVNFENTSSVNSLTLNSDNAVTIHGAGTDTIARLIDHSGALATIDVTGSGSVAITSFSTPGLLTIDATGDTGNLTIGNATTALAQNNLHITGGTGATDTFFVSGANLVLNDHSTFTSLVASGSGDTITALSMTGSATDAFGNAAAVVSGNNENVTFTGGALVAGGSGDNITILGGGEVNVGSKATVAVSNEGNSISITGDVTGATSSGSFAYTTINAPASGTGVNLTHAAIDPTELTINFNNAGTEAFAAGSGNFAQSLVNVSGATSLGNALDIAAHQALVIDHEGLFSGTPGVGTNTQVSTSGVLQEKGATGLLDWFQYGGNTYVVEAVNKGTGPAAHAALGTGDVVVKLAGLVDLSHASMTSAHAVHFG